MKKEEKIKTSRDLCADEIERYLNMLNENIVLYDCASLCKDYYNGIPFCCVSDNAVPILYKAEYEYLRKKTNLWFKWTPKNKDDKELFDYVRDDQIFAECQGIKHCDRRYRSLTCRTFPLEPYIDLRGVFVGLTFMKDFIKKDKNTGTKCPLALKSHDIRQEFIDSHFVYWQELMLRLTDEYKVYTYSSKSLRRHAKKKNENLIVLFPSWYKKTESVKKWLI